MTEKEKEVFEAIRQELARSLPLGARAYLYGSRARGDNREDSDWDILILMRDEDFRSSDSDLPAYNLWIKGLDYGEEINAQTYSYTKWEKYSFTPFCKTVAEDAILIHNTSEAS